MSDQTTSGHADWFRDVRRVLDVTEVTPGLPLPFVSSDRATFYFTNIVHAGDAAEAVAAARTILSYALRVTFIIRMAVAGDDTGRMVFEALMPSGLAVDIVAKAEHMAGRDSVLAQPELAGAA